MTFPITSPLIDLVPYVVKEVKENPVKTIVPAVVEGEYAVEYCGRMQHSSQKLEAQKAETAFTIQSHFKFQGLLQSLV